MRQKQLFDAQRQTQKLGRQQGSKFRQMTQLRQIWSHWAQGAREEARGGMGRRRGTTHRETPKLRGGFVIS